MYEDLSFRGGVARCKQQDTNHVVQPDSLDGSCLVVWVWVYVCGGGYEVCVFAFVDTCACVYVACVLICVCLCRYLCVSVCACTVDTDFGNMQYVMSALLN